MRSEPWSPFKFESFRWFSVQIHSGGKRRGRALKKSVIVFASMLLIAGVGFASVRWVDGDLWRGLVSDPLVPVGIATANRFDPFYENMVASLPPQARAELALSLALRGQLGATDFIIENAAHWRGQFGPSPSLDTLVGLGQSSPHIEVRMATFELYLAAYDLDKSELQVDQQLATLAELGWNRASFGVGSFFAAK